MDFSTYKGPGFFDIVVAKLTACVLSIANTLNVPVDGGWEPSINLALGRDDRVGEGERDRAVKYRAVRLTSP